MKKFIAMTLGMLAFGVVLEAHAESGEVHRVCKKMAKVAESTMELRQLGATLSETALAVTLEGELSVGRIVMEAYSEPRHDDPEDQVAAQNEFAKRWYLLCRRHLLDY